MSAAAAEEEIVEFARVEHTGQLVPNRCLGSLLKSRTQMACRKESTGKNKIMQGKQLPRGSVRMFHASVGILHEEHFKGERFVTVV